jgi:hypothetical protein
MRSRQTTCACPPAGPPARFLAACPAEQRAGAARKIALALALFPLWPALSLPKFFSLPLFFPFLPPQSLGRSHRCAGRESIVFSRSSSSSLKGSEDCRCGYTLGLGLEREEKPLEQGFWEASGQSVPLQPFPLAPPTRSAKSQIANHSGPFQGDRASSRTSLD